MIPKKGDIILQIDSDDKKRCIIECTLERADKRMKNKDEEDVYRCKCLHSDWNGDTLGKEYNWWISKDNISFRKWIKLKDKDEAMVELL